MAQDYQLGTTYTGGMNIQNIRPYKSVEEFFSDTSPNRKSQLFINRRIYDAICHGRG